MTPTLPSRILLPAALASLALAAPATALAASSQSGTVLAVGPNHVLQIVDAAGDVVTAKLPQTVSGAKLGSRVSLRHSHGGVQVVSVSSRRASHVSFHARVLSEHGRRIDLQLADGHVIHIAPGRPVPSVERGERVLVNESRSGKVSLRVLGHSSHGTRGAGSKSTSSASPAGGGTSSPATPSPSSDPTASGVVTAVGSSSITLQLASGSSLTLSLPASTLNESNQNGDINPCETVNVAYNGSQLQELTPTGITASASVVIPGEGDCESLGDGEDDVVGTITAESMISLTLSIPGQGSESFPQLGEVSDEGNLPGTVIDLTYDPTNDNEVVSTTDVELYTTATVRSVDESAETPTMSVTDAFTGQTETFAADDADFSGIATGDQVGILYWVEGGQSPALQADDAVDFTNGAVD